MVVRRIVERDAVQDKAVRVVCRNQPCAEIAQLLWFGGARHLPPTVIVPDDLRTAASINHSVAHDRGVLHIHGDERLAKSAPRRGGHRWTPGRIPTFGRIPGRNVGRAHIGHRAAKKRTVSGRVGIIVLRIARAIECRALVDQQRHPFPHVQRTGQKRIPFVARSQLDSHPRLACIQSLLDPGCIGRLLIDFSQLLAVSRLLCEQLGACCWQHRFGHRARILRQT